MSLSLALLTTCTQALARAAPRNIFLLIADGAGYNTFAATSMYQGRWDPQAEHPAGEVYGGTSWIHVGKACWTLAAAAGEPPDPSRAYSSRAAWSARRGEGTLSGRAGLLYPYRHRATAWHAETYPDSAATMTQMMTGVKTYNGAVNYSIDGTPLTAFTELIAEDRGVGVVTSVPVSHATPAAAAGAHNASRRQYAAIAQEILSADVVDVWMGAGHPLFDDSGQLAAAPTPKFIGGDDDWDALNEGRSPWHLLDTKAGFEKLAAGHPPPGERLLGLAPVARTLQANRPSARPGMAPGMVPLIETVPSLKTITMAATQALSQTHPGGFFLMAEGGAVDWAMHGNAAGHMIEEMIDFNETVEAVVEWVEANGGWEENLVIITADHDHLFQGAPTRREPFPLVVDKGAGAVPGHTWLWSSHSNHLVPMFARGSGAEHIAQMADETDPHRGPYIDDTEVFDVLIQAWGIPDPR